ncbi:small RNA 2'-O-methyltransferase-like [Amphiura filiformis]|uniref:small RNA 2'-O-methyltransferase-like n=1 Tax=Amphiura filiformis TaxID=82378 RepID=UPI003B218E4A
MMADSSENQTADSSENQKEKCCTDEDLESGIADLSENQKQRSYFCTDDDPESGPIFNPKVSQQRYTFVRELIRSYKSKKVIDMGCGECQLIVRLKREMCIEQLAGIDINVNFLDASKHLIQPLLYDYIHGREAPLEATLYQGSIAECDSRLQGWDLLAFVEVIEHLEDDILQKAPYVIFGFLKPAVVVITTPNKDFNVLFPDMETKFRHWDHKFEWTRQEFQEWGDQICTTYGYKVRYTGVGKGPDGTEHLGTCSQIGVFELLEKQEGGEVLTDATQKELQPYVVVQHSIHPYKPDTKSIQDKILLEAEYLTNKLSLDASRQNHKEEKKEKGTEMVSVNEVEDGQFDDAEEDDLQCDFQNNYSSKVHPRTCEINDTNTRFYEDEEGNAMFEVPLARLMEFDSLHQMCSSSIDLLRSVLKSSKKLTLSSDELSVLYLQPAEKSLLVDESDLQEEEICKQTLVHVHKEYVTEESWDE